MNGRAVVFDLDHNATTPVLPEVLEHFVAIERDVPGNPASVHGAGRRARAVIESARERIAAALAVPVDDVFFVGSATEADNLAVLGLGDPTSPVLLAETEHPAVREPALRRGACWWSVDARGQAQVVEPDDRIGLVALVHAQSEVGTVQPIAAAARVAASKNVPLHVDAAQSLGRLPLHEVVRLAHTVALSPHKAGGLRGLGVLLARDAGTGIRPLATGGGQERGLRPGTQSPALIAANALAIERAVREQQQRAATMAAARAAFLTRLQATSVECLVLTPLEASLPNTLMLQCNGVEGRNLMPALDLAGLHASQGAACSSGSSQPPRVLTAMGLPIDDARTCVRVSFACSHSPEFGAAAGATFGEVLERLRKKNRGF